MPPGGTDARSRGRTGNCTSATPGSCRCSPVGRLGPHALAKYDRELAVIDGIGLTDVEMDAVITLVQNHVEGVARRRIEADQAVRRTGITDEQWWRAVQPALAEVFDPATRPIAARVGQAAGEAHQAAHNPEHAYAFSLDRLLQGIAALIEERAGVNPRRRRSRGAPATRRR